MVMFKIHLYFCVKGLCHTYNGNISKLPWNTIGCIVGLCVHHLKHLTTLKGYDGYSDTSWEPNKAVAGQFRLLAFPLMPVEVVKSESNMKQVGKKGQ